MAKGTYLNVAKDAAFFEALRRIDVELAEKARMATCPHCGSALHYATYKRAGRGAEGIPEACRVRLGLCCGREGCRRRVLPASCLFFGRRWYWSVVVLIATALVQLDPEVCVEELTVHLGVSRATVYRWLEYFRGIFPGSLVWQRLRGLVTATVADHRLPGSLLEHLVGAGGRVVDGLRSALRLLSGGQARFPGVDPFHAEFDSGV